MSEATKTQDAGDAAEVVWPKVVLDAFGSAQAAPRPPTWCEDVGEMPPIQQEETMP
jgi:hypothetical protein